jgi:FAD-linked sulfhydryl oxidase
MGRGSWELIHRLAAKFPKQPTPEQTEDASQFFSILSRLYPCEDCAQHFRGLLKVNPVRASSNSELSVWACEAHNAVNERNNKTLFNCSLDSLSDKWGDCGCFEKKNGTKKEVRESR